jgi:hypothetical protein
MSKYRRIKYEDRCQIYALSKRGSSQGSIAEVLGVSQSAVSREMHRNRGQRGYLTGQPRLRIAGDRGTNTKRSFRGSPGSCYHPPYVRGSLGEQVEMQQKSFSIRSSFLPSCVTL